MSGGDFPDIAIRINRRCPYMTSILFSSRIVLTISNTHSLHSGGLRPLKPYSSIINPSVPFSSAKMYWNLSTLTLNRVGLLGRCSNPIPTSFLAFSFTILLGRHELALDVDVSDHDEL